MNIILSGACGRMGREVAAAAMREHVSILCGVDKTAETYGSFPVYPDFAQVQPAADSVVIDFSKASALEEVLAFCVSNHLPLVLATTGYTDAQLQAIAEAAKVIPVFRSANMSLGIHVLRLLSRQAAKLLPGFDIEIVEKHHNQKADAPSGTAIMLYDAVASADNYPVYDRHEVRRKRDPKEIGMSSVRGGTVPGEHEVGFYGSAETVLLTHTAQSRSIFAEGALKAAAFIASQKPCREYTMDDMIHL